jgi:ATP-binding cassette, subfamily B, bacterial
MQRLTNSAIQHDFKTIKWMIPVGLLIVVISGLLAYWNTYLQDVVASQVEQNVQNDLYQHTLRLKTEHFDSHHSGDLISRLTYDIHRIGDAVGVHILNLIRMCLTAVGALVYLLILNWRLTLISLCLVPPAITATLVVSRLTRSNSTQVSESQSKLQILLSESLQGLIVIRSFTLEEPFTRRFMKSSRHMMRLQLQNSKLRGGASIGGSMAHSISYLLCFSLGAYDVAHGTLTMGALLAFLSLMGNLIGPMLSGPHELGSYQAALAAATRVWEAMDEEAEPDTLKYAASHGFGSTIEFDDVSFHYPGAMNALDHVSIRAPAGTIVALVGPSGAGKSTLFKLLLGLYQPTEGRITLNQKSIGEMSLQNLRRRIAYVSQDTFLFSGSIRENIQFGCPGSTDEHIIEAAKSANAHDFICQLPDGYDTQVGERAVRLSGGQRQRIAIARALLKDSPILLLDEATSALDPESEQMIHGALRNLMKDRTTLVIAHRLSTVVDADYLYVMDKGRVVEQGSHTVLMNEGGVYARLFGIQFEQIGQLQHEY